MTAFNSRKANEKLTKWIIPAAVNHTDIKIETSCASLMELEVFKIFKYCKISGTVINLKALKNLSPGNSTKQIK